MVLRIVLRKSDANRQHKTGAFKVATLTSWLVILNRNQLEDIIRSSEDDLSFSEAAKDVSVCYFVGPLVTDLCENDRPNTPNTSLDQRLNITLITLQSFSLNSPVAFPGCILL